MTFKCKDFQSVTAFWLSKILTLVNYSREAAVMAWIFYGGLPGAMISNSLTFHFSTPPVLIHSSNQQLFYMLEDGAGAAWHWGFKAGAPFGPGDPCFTVCRSWKNITELRIKSCACQEWKIWKKWNEWSCFKSSLLVLWIVLNFEFLP